VTDFLFLSLRQNSHVPRLSLLDDGGLVLRRGDWSSSVQHPTPAIRDALLTLATTGDYEHRLTEGILRSEGIEALATFYYYLQFFSRLRLLERSVLSGDDRLATLVPVSAYFEYPARGLESEVRYVLSRFAYMRVEAGESIVESALSHGRLILHDWRAAALTRTLARASSPEQASKPITGLSAGSAGQVMTLMLNAGMLTWVDEAGRSAEDENPSLRTWEFHDLLFHSRSREGRHDLAIGGTYRFAGEIDPPAALKPAHAAQFVPLARPDLELSMRCDPPFALVQEHRRSIREYSAKPIALRQLAEFLYRVGRVTACHEVEVQTPQGAVGMGFAHRPYPGGGALYEIELYLAVKACEDLAAGLYHYDPERHRLGRIAERTADVEELLAGASRGTGIEADRLQVLVILAARFQRMAWKYSSIAYGATLKHVGVLYQTMYLVATAMDLAPCAVGCGNADLFARAAGTDYYAETSVGEFLLGSRAAESVPSAVEAAT
jgi:SagB-type dehydrogenase family enzyme